MSRQMIDDEIKTFGVCVQYTQEMPDEVKEHFKQRGIQNILKQARFEGYSLIEEVSIGELVDTHSIDDEETGENIPIYFYVIEVKCKRDAQ